MKSVSVKQCFRQGLILLGLFLLFFLVMMLVALVQDMGFWLAFGIVLFFGSIILVFACYYLIKAVSIAKKSAKLEMQNGKIVNWNTHARMFGSVSVMLNNKEYSTSAYFTKGEARSLVGKEISFCIINEALFIFSIK